jgi:hypothetical protein
MGKGWARDTHEHAQTNSIPVGKGLGNVVSDSSLS